MYPEPEWKRNMRVPVSKFEIETIAEMGRRGLYRGLETNEVVILRFCKPDLKWDILKRAVFLDGIEVHSSPHQQDRDERITSELERLGWLVLRERYKPNPSKARKKEIWDEIEEFIATSEHFKKL